MATKTPVPNVRARITFDVDVPLGEDAADYRAFFIKLMHFYYPRHKVCNVQAVTLSEEVPTAAEQQARCDASVAELRKDIAELEADGALRKHAREGLALIQQPAFSAVDDDEDLC